MAKYRVLEEKTRDRVDFYPQVKRFGIWWPITLIGYSTLERAWERIDKRNVNVTYKKHYK